MSSEVNETKWFLMSPSQVLDHLGSNDDKGLSKTDVTDRREKHGFNEIKLKTTPWWVRLLRQFLDLLVIILIAAAVISGGLHTIVDGHLEADEMVIIGVVVLNALLGFYQEGKAEAAIEALKKFAVPKCKCLRDGHIVQLHTRELVPGDLVILGSGDSIPADVYFLEAVNLQTVEAALTGEPYPIDKNVGAIQGNPELGDRKNMGFLGTNVVRGNARAVVVDTALQTEFGKIADEVNEADPGKTPLQRKMHHFVKVLIYVILAVGVFNFGYGAFCGFSLIYSFMGAVSLIVAVIPEMLPALVTSNLSLAGKKMASLGAQVKTLPAAETMGSVSALCFDKTGTLTQGIMKVIQVWTAGREFTFTGTGYNTEGEIQEDGSPIPNLDENAELKLLLECGLLCNEAQISDTGDPIGTPTEAAILVAAMKGGITRNGFRIVEKIPFDSDQKYSAVLIEKPDKTRWVIMVGAPETAILPRCTQNVDGMDAIADGYAEKALRTLGVAIKPADASDADLRHDDLTEMRFVGFFGIYDPPRQSAIEAIKGFVAAGIRSIMITGDNPKTAVAISKELGIPADKVVTGTDITEQGNDEAIATFLDSVVQDTSVFARVRPKHKKQIAAALQRSGCITGMTGDGVNDAPALAQADIGIAMGLSGTDVAKGAANMILTDDNIATILKAVEVGRHVWNNLKLAILYTLPTNAAQGALIMFAILLANFVPVFSARFVLEPVQILWINLLDSLLLTMPLMAERMAPGLLSSPPRDPKEKIIDAMFIRRVVIQGFAIAAPSFWIYYYYGSAAVVDGKLINPHLLTQAQTAAFWAVLLAHLGYVMTARSLRTPCHRMNPFGNKYLIYGIVASIGIRFIPTAFPVTATLFKTAEFPASWWPAVLACTIPAFLLGEGIKWYERMTDPDGAKT